MPIGQRYREAGVQTARIMSKEEGAVWSGHPPGAEPCLAETRVRDREMYAIIVLYQTMGRVDDCIDELRGSIVWIARK